MFSWEWREVEADGKNVSLETWHRVGRGDLALISWVLFTCVVHPSLLFQPLHFHLCSSKDIYTNPYDFRIGLSETNEKSRKHTHTHRKPGVSERDASAALKLSMFVICSWRRGWWANLGRISGEWSPLQSPGRGKLWLLLSTLAVLELKIDSLSPSGPEPGEGLTIPPYIRRQHSHVSESLGSLTCPSSCHECSFIYVCFHSPKHFIWISIIYKHRSDREKPHLISTIKT